MSMRRRTSLPRLKILPSRENVAADPTVPSTPSLIRPKTGIPALTVESLVARNREAGAPLNNNSTEAEEDFPYQCGPKEILPGLYLGSEQNAKDPAILRQLGITQVICCAKEVACPWLLDEMVPESLTEVDYKSPATSNSTGTANTLSAVKAAPVSATSAAAPMFLVLPSTSKKVDSATITQRQGRSPSPSRPIFLRPAVSTPNFKEKSRSHSMSHFFQPDFAEDTSGSSSKNNTPHCPDGRMSTTHAGYLHRHFPGNSKNGRPALDYTKFPWGHDEDNVAQHFDTFQICELIDKARQNGGRCLVHCQLGVSRSATLLIGYCMRQAFRKSEPSHLGDVKSMHDSYTFVREKSRWVAPNIGLLVSSTI